MDRIPIQRVFHGPIARSWRLELLEPTLNTEEAKSFANTKPEMPPGPGAATQPWNRIAVAAAFLSLLLAMAFSVDKYWRLLPLNGGCDFYYFICFARDLLRGNFPVHESRYLYFPGAYYVWEGVMRVFGEDLSALKLAIAGLYILNTILLGGLTYRLTRSFLLAAFAVVYYFSQGMQIEGWAGTSEFLGTAFFLAGLWVWTLLNERDEPWLRWWGSVITSFLFATCAFMKQQDGLLLLGFSTLIGEQILNRIRGRSFQLSTLSVPLLTALSFVLISVVEKGNLSGIAMGLGTYGGYEPVGGYFYNLKYALTFIGLLLLSAPVAAAVWFVNALKKEIPSRSMSMMGLASVSGLATTLQYCKRGYLHYSMLGLPVLILSLVLLLFTFAKRFKNGKYAGAIMGGFVVIFCVGNVDPFYPGKNRELTPGARGEGLWSRSSLAWDQSRQANEVAQVNSLHDVLEICPYLSANEAALIIPPRDNKIHWFCNTRAHPLYANGYGWGKVWTVQELQPVVRADDLRQVVLIKTPSGKYESEIWPGFDYEKLLGDLRSLGFQKVASLPYADVFKKCVSAGGTEKDLSCRAE